MTEYQPGSGPSSSASRRPGTGRPEAGPAVLTPPAGLPIVPAQRPSSDPLAAKPAGPPAPPPARREVSTTLMCRCGHGFDQHEHHRAGRDCGACGPELCARFRATGGPWATLRRSVARLLRGRPD